MIKKKVTSALPSPVLSAYHFVLAFIAALFCGFPSRDVVVVGVTGTKGKSSTIEYLNIIFETAGWKTAISSSIRFKIDTVSEPNTRRMTIPGRFFVQNFIAQAASAGCGIVFIELTSEGARQHRHRFISLNALLFINLSPEHIESHGSLQAYADAKFELGKQLARSSKRPRYMIANADDAESGRYLSLSVESPIPFSLSSATPFEARERNGFFTFGETRITVPLPGEFSLMNALAAATFARAFGIREDAIARGIARLTHNPGRAEDFDEGQSFTAVVDNAHTPDSLRSIYEAYGTRRKVCVLGSTGGGRDLWKRPVMGGVADTHCDTIILTNEDPYDEDPRGIVDMIARGIEKHTPETIMDRRSAIARALSLARSGDCVIITGKGTDPTIQGARGKSVPWSDAQVVREELRKMRG